MIGRRAPAPDDRVLYQVASHVLDYPGTGLPGLIPVCRAALDEQPDAEPVAALRDSLAYLESQELAALQRSYVELFDLSGRHTLYLSYWTDGDTRRRGEVLARFKAVYRAAGAVIDDRGELPDYLPLLLEFTARADREAGRTLLNAYRASLELVRLSLDGPAPHYAAAVTAVCATLPGRPAADRAAALALAAPPAELVGLAGYGGPQ